MQAAENGGGNGGGGGGGGGGSSLACLLACLLVTGHTALDTALDTQFHSLLIGNARVLVSEASVKGAIRCGAVARALSGLTQQDSEIGRAVVGGCWFGRLPAPTILHHHRMRS